jgi:acyl-CoA reductase-like NAD-dependent aldehyde dehydrogenase
MLAKGANSSEGQHSVSAVVERLRAAQHNWAATPISDRLRMVRCFRHLLAEQAETVAAMANEDQSRPVSEILASEILPLADACKFLEREAKSILAPRRLGNRGRAFWLSGVKSEIRREPFGLVFIIAPSNYPIFLPGVQVLQALVAGNAVLLKPGVGGSRAALELARLLRAAGLPEDLLRVLPQAAEAAQSAIESCVDKVFFTGSAHVGTQVLAQLAPRAVPAVMELSGCDAVIVRADADLDLTVRALVFGLRLNSGRTCIAPRRVIVVRAVATELEGRLTRALAGCATADLSPAQQLRLARPFLDALSDGAHLLAGEVRPDTKLVGPLVLAGVAPNAALLSEDIFGSVMAVMTVADDEEAVHLANQSPYGLGATIFSRDVITARSLANRLAAGVVVINDLIAPTADARLPFGGRKLSGFGATRGREGLLEMTTQKVVVLNRGKRRPHFNPPQSWHARFFTAFIRLTHGSGVTGRLSALRQLVRAAMSFRNSKVSTPSLEVHASRITHHVLGTMRNSKTS